MQLTNQAQVPECSQLMGSIIESTCGCECRLMIDERYLMLSSDHQCCLCRILCWLDIPGRDIDPRRALL